MVSNELDTYIWFDVWCISGNRLAVFVNQELREIPLDETTTSAAAAATLVWSHMHIQYMLQCNVGNTVDSDTQWHD